MTHSIDNNAPSSYRSFAEIRDENHILIHVAPTNRNTTTPWAQYLHDLDDFFIRLYEYHQKSGFMCLICGQLLELVQIVYSVFLPIFFLNYVNYDLLFGNLPNPAAKVHIYDVIKPIDLSTIPWLQWLAIDMALVFFLWKAWKTIHSVIVNLAIRQFYKNVLHISDCSSLTWQDVQTRIINSRQNFLAQDGHLTELDIHNRILRHSNYMIALINRGILPIYYRVPVIGETTFFTQSLLYNCKLLFFRSWFKCIFEKNWLIGDDIKNSSHRQIAAKRLEWNIMKLAIINLFVSPGLLLSHILYFFYSNAALVKRDPVVLGLRHWSLYSRWFCRHFNELDHQLNDRLNHAYKPAKNYMDAFTSPLMEIFARGIRFAAGAALAILLILTVYNEHVIQVEHILTTITGLWLIWSAASCFIPSEVPLRFTKTELYEQILQHIHYVPHNYPPFTHQARSSMGDLFQYKIMKLLEDLLSTVATPYIMIRHLRPRSLEIVDFFRNYTIETPGTGDVCVFSMMNIKENGNPIWQPLITSMSKSADRESDIVSQEPTKIRESMTHSRANMPPYQDSLSHSYHGDTTQYQSFNWNAQQAEVQNDDSMQQFERETLHNHALPLLTEFGKLELSLINFKLQNPSWNPSYETQREFIQQVTSQAIEQASSRMMNNLSYTQDDQSNNQITSSGAGLFPRQRAPQTITDIDSSTAVSLSTMFLHEHASRLPMSTNFPSTSSSSQVQRPKTEKDPLL